MKKGVQKIFSQVVEKYELINHLLTWGLDVHWRKKAAKLVEPQPGQKWLDVCTGTGEMVTALARKAERTSFDSKKVRAGRKNLEDRRNQPPFSLGSQPRGVEEAEASVAEDPLLSSPALFVALDFCLAMLPYLRETKVPYLSCPLHLVQADVRRLPFSEGVFDGVTISFATRNLGLDQQKLLPFFQEIWRVLKPQGVFLNLETSQPQPKWLRRLFHLYLRLTVKPLGIRLSGSSPAYAYLAYTIPRFLSADEVSEVLQKAGFSLVKVKRLFFGVAAIHLAYK